MHHAILAPFADRELDEILKGGQQKASGPQVRNRTEAGTARKPVEQGDLCPICYDDIHGVDLLQLTWCHKGCGQNVHGKCMQVWMAHGIKTKTVRPSLP